MNSKKTYLGMILIFFILGFLYKYTDIDLFNILFIVYMITVFGWLIFYLIIYPLCNYIFGIASIRKYKIKKGNHYTSYLPILKPYFGSKKIKLSIKIDFNTNKLNFNSHQVNKLFGYNKGLPSIFGAKIHKNSTRIGYKLLGSTIVFVKYIIKDGRMQDDIELFRTNIYNINGILTTGVLDFDLDIEGWGYMLPRPYFGGKSPALFDILVETQYYSK